MKVIKTIRNGQHGSQRFVKEWGENLIYVRYRLNEAKKNMITTIEIVVDERKITDKNRRFTRYNAVRNRAEVLVKINYSENELRRSRGKMEASTPALGLAV